MANKINWSATYSLTTVMSTGLNSLANDALCAGSEVDNTTLLDQYGQAELYLASVDLSAQTAPYVEIYLVPTLDGTNYSDGADGSIDPGAATLVAALSLRVVNGAQRVNTGLFVLPPTKFKLVLHNKAGAAFASASNTLKLGVVSDEVQ